MFPCHKVITSQQADGGDGEYDDKFSGTKKTNSQGQKRQILRYNKKTLLFWVFTLVNKRQLTPKLLCSWCLSVTSDSNSFKEIVPIEISLEKKTSSIQGSKP